MRLVFHSSGKPPGLPAVTGIRASGRPALLCGPVRSARAVLLRLDALLGLAPGQPVLSLPVAHGEKVRRPEAVGWATDQPVVVEDADSYNCFWPIPFRKSARVAQYGFDRDRDWRMEPRLYN